MKNAIKQFGIIAIMAVIVSLSLAACGNGTTGRGATGGEDNKPPKGSAEDSFSSVAEFAAWLAKQPDNISSNPYTVKLKVSDLADIGDVLKDNSSKYVSLDLSGSTITDIGYYQFQYCTSLTSITIGSATEYIGSFEGCENLTGINVAAGNSFLTSENGVLYNKDKTSLYIYPAGKTAASFTIPNSVTTIEGYSFLDCISLTSITIPDSVTSIGSWAFVGCENLTSINIPNGVTSIDGMTFYKCTSLTSITIPSGVTRIGSGAFHSCESLASINIPNGVTKIEDQTFSGCASLTSITIPSGVTSIGMQAFYDCGLTSMSLPSGVTSIGSGAFAGCESLASINIPNGVTKIEEQTFIVCGLTSITIPAGVTFIGRMAFAGSYSLTSVIFAGNSITSLAENVFPGNFHSVFNGQGTYTCSNYVWTK